MKRQDAYLLLAIAIGQFLVPLLPLIGLGEAFGARAMAAGIPPELPPGIFFSIWSVIFALYLMLAMCAVFRPGYLEENLAQPLILAGSSNLAWMLSAQLIGSQTLNLLLLLPIILFAWESSHRLHRMGGFDGTLRRLNGLVLTGLFSGWSAIAVSISVPGVIRALRDLGPTDQVWISLWIALGCAAGLAWLYATRVSRGLWFFVALGWGLTGIVVNNWSRTGTQWLAIVSAGVGIYILWRRLRFGARPAFE